MDRQRFGLVERRFTSLLMLRLIHSGFIMVINTFHLMPALMQD
jgi:hypothetical protein